MNKYDDIIDLPHHESKRHPRMSMMNRAAQFAPFAALNGHDEAIAETARTTTPMENLSEDEKAELSRRLSYALSRIAEKRELIFTVFVADKLKSGGEYVMRKGRIKKYVENERMIILTDDTKIKTETILDIKGAIFD